MAGVGQPGIIATHQGVNWLLELVELHFPLLYQVQLQHQRAMSHKMVAVVAVGEKFALEVPLEVSMTYYPRPFCNQDVWPGSLAVKSIC